MSKDAIERGVQNLPDKELNPDTHTRSDRPSQQVESDLDTHEWSDDDIEYFEAGLRYRELSDMQMHQSRRTKHGDRNTPSLFDEAGYSKHKMWVFPHY